MMTNEEAKHEAIREAWGDLWVWIDANPKAKARALMFDGFVFPTDLPASVDQREMEYRHKANLVRPVSLTGIENNNGWNRIDGPVALPKQAGTCTMTPWE